MRIDQKLERVNKWRWKDAPEGWHSADSDGWNGIFIVPVEGEMWKVICSDKEGWKHVSISNAQKKQLPGWNVMCRIKDLFFDDESWAVQYHPAKSEYVNDHPYTLHLWEPLEAALPKPLAIMV
jgi:hypothetical protein